MRDLYYIGGACLIAIVLGTLLFFFGPPSLARLEDQPLSGATASSTIPFTVLGQGPKAVSITQRTNYRITNAGDLQSLWQLVYGDADLPRVPLVDFTKYEVLGVFDGTHSTSGYTIAVKDISELSPLRVVTLEHTVPGTHCKVTSAQTSPFELVQVPLTTLEITHSDVIATSTCY